MVLCFCCCCVPLWAHSIATGTSACSRRPGHCQCVLPWPYAREMVAGASRGGLASERVLGEVRKASPPMGREGIFWALKPTHSPYPSADPYPAEEIRDQPAEALLTQTVTVSV